MRRQPESRFEERHRRGRAAEALAREHLIASGYSILQANVRYPVGEIDLVAMEGVVLCFVEIRSASLLDFGGAAASVTRQKQKKIIQAARWFLKSCRIKFSEIRFDVVAIQWNKPPKQASLELIRAAFDCSGIS